MDRGLFITIEGGEGAGKTTLISHLQDFCVKKNLVAIATREPGGTLLAEDLRQFLLTSKKNYAMSPLSEALIVLAARSDHVEKVILPALSSGKIVLCDRFIDSTLAYQALAHNLPLQLLYDLCTTTVPLLPDLTFYIDISPEIAEGRRRLRAIDDRMEEKDRSFHTTIRAAFLFLAEKFPERIQTLDGNLPPDDLADVAKNLLIRRFPQVL